MATQHTVKAGETLSSIAQQNGFRDWNTIYNAKENAAFRKKRPNPNLIVPGDIVTIPDKKDKTVPVSSGQPLKLKVLPVVPQTAEFQLGFFDQNEPSAAVNVLTITFQVSGQPVTAVRKVGPDGVLRLVDPDVQLGSTVDILSIRDETEVPAISYDEFVAKLKALPVNNSNVFQLPDKRKIINRIATKLSVVRRASWGARPPKVNPMPQDWDFNMIVIHHSGLGGRKDPKDIQNFHMDKGEDPFDDIAYQYLILPNGSIVEGRYLSHEGASNAAVNTGKIGILVTGNFEPSLLHHEDTLSAAQSNSTKTLANELKAQFPKIKRLVGHRDLKNTECPGDDLYSQVPSFRAATGLAP